MFSPSFSLLCSLAMALHGGTVALQEPPTKPAALVSQVDRVLVQREATLRAKYLITVADDFIVEVYHNGKCIPLVKRHLMVERFGATVEKIDVEVRKGDWLVFNVVNNRLRWGGTCYFAVAGCFAKGEFGFVSQRETGDWSAIDTPSDVDRFISEKSAFRHRPAQEIVNPWSDGLPLMREYAGAGWNGTPLWGSARNTWIKVQVE